MLGDATVLDLPDEGCDELGLALATLEEAGWPERVEVPSDRPANKLSVAEHAVTQFGDRANKRLVKLLLSGRDGVGWRLGKDAQRMKR